MRWRCTMTRRPVHETVDSADGGLLSTTPTGAECDNLYVDMNGIIHPQSAAASLGVCECAMSARPKKYDGKKPSRTWNL